MISGLRVHDATGVGEELLFRGVLQAEFGLASASIIYGAMHTRGPGPLAAGAWAGLMGAALGWLTLATGGLLAPFVAHTLSGAAAFAYVRRGRDCLAVAEPSADAGG